MHWRRVHRRAPIEGQKENKRGRIRMRKESIEKLAREKAEKEAMQEAMANNIVIWFPLMFIAFMMMLGGAPYRTHGSIFHRSACGWSLCSNHHMEKCL